MDGLAVFRVLRRLFWLLPVSLVLASCATAPMRSLSCVEAPDPKIQVSADGATATTRLSVLSYNLEGLAWPARSGRARYLREIGRHLDVMRRNGTGPDVVLFQEMFRGAAKKAVAASGYPAIASGSKRARQPRRTDGEALPKKRYFRDGGFGLRLTGSGLAIASRYPIRGTDMSVYGACAGLDCFARKGIMLTQISIPGVPAPVNIYNTHMNAAEESRVSEGRHLAAHARQALEASAFIRRTHDANLPVILGGDFNMMHSDARWEIFSRYQSLNLVHRVCEDSASGCEVLVSWDGDAPWMDTQDLQFYWPGRDVSVRPVKVEAMFDGTPGNPKLSDHDGFMVTYELSWPVNAPAQPRCAPQPMGD